MLTALALVPAGAHLFELPNKIGLDQEPYFIVQGIYRGWALFGIVLFGALAANLKEKVEKVSGTFFAALRSGLAIAREFGDPVPPRVGIRFSGCSGQ